MRMSKTGKSAFDVVNGYSEQELANIINRYGEEKFARNIAKNIVYSGSKDNVKLTMINGKILYENGEFFVSDDIEGIYWEANAIIKRIDNTINEKC